MLAGKQENVTEREAESEARPGFARDYRDLLTYQKARELARAIFEATRRFPKEETYSLTDQVRRSSRSVGAQIAEAWAVRSYERSFVSKLSIADAEQFETQHWLDIAGDCGDLDAHAAAQLVEQCAVVGRMLNGMISKSAAFCQPFAALRESSASYVTNADVEILDGDDELFG